LHIKLKFFLMVSILASLHASNLFAGDLLDRTTELEADFDKYFMQGGIEQSNNTYGSLEAEHELLFTSTQYTLAFLEAKVESIFNEMEPLQNQLMNLPQTANATELMIELTETQIHYFQANAVSATYKLSRLKRIRDSRANLDVNYQNINLELSQYNYWMNNDGPLIFRDALLALLIDVRLSSSSAEKSECLSRVRTLRRRLVGYYGESAKRNGNESVVVEVLVGDEPCFLLVDTGAELVTLSQSLIVALGWQDLPGTEETFFVAGGNKIQGKLVSFPEVSYNGFSVQDVEAGIIPSGNLGFDGLLGLSYLGHFIVEIDLLAEMPLKLNNK